MGVLWYRFMDDEDSVTGVALEASKAQRLREQTDMLDLASALQKQPAVNEEAKGLPFTLGVSTHLSADRVWR